MATTQAAAGQPNVLGGAAIHSKPPAPAIKPELPEFAKTIACGSAAGIASKFIEYPFDTIKVRLQSQPDASRGIRPRYTGPLDCFRQSVKQHGVLGLYRGVSAPIAGSAFETSSSFFFENLGRETVYWSGWCNRDDGALPLWALWYSGGFSGACGSFVLTPIEMVKCNMQVPLGYPTAGATANGNTVRKAPTIRSVIRGIYKQGGFRGFWYGLSGTFIREAGGNAAWFGCKETATEFIYQWHERGLSSEAERKSLREKPLPLWQQAAAGAIGGLSYNFSFFPADTVKSRMQTSLSRSRELGGAIMHEKTTFWKEAEAIWRQHGLRGFYRGCGITLARSAPSSALIFVVYDWLRRQV
ncbi:hypothetical protein FQN54_005710 [Arachnomyces sp. PD_36]|nr:hypothetical protein FQN54_005710 [Arachnomyces sp. PD_36]